MEELSSLSRRGIQTVKLVDRTFNADPGRALAIWRHVIGMETETTFHFEVAAHLIDEATLALLSTAPPGRIQLEAGIQSIHPDVLHAVHRGADPVRTLARAGDLVRLGNLKVHLDLIAGLPGESLDRFAGSFNAVYALSPDTLQVGILKILPGTPMSGIADRLGYRYSANPPYRVFSSNALDTGGMYLIEDIGHLVDVYCNSSAFPSTMENLTGRAETPFAFFRSLADGWRREQMFDRGISRDEAAAFLFRQTGYDGQIARSLRQDVPRWEDDREWRGFLRRRYGFGMLESDII